MKTQIYPDRHVELVERCKLGERKAQYELYKSYSKAMFNICMRILNHMGEAEDALQEAFVDAFTNLHQFRQQSTFGAWLKQIVVNKAINHMRSRKVKWVEIDGLKGLQFREANPEKPDDFRRMHWMAYRKYAGQVQLVNVMVSSNGRGFEKQQDAMYGVLYSTKLVH